MSAPAHIRTRAIAGAAAVCLAAVAACRDSTPPERTPTFTGRWAGRPWSGDASARLNRGGTAGDTLYVFGTHPVAGQDWTDQYIRVRAVVSAPGTYVLGGDAVEVVDLIGGDVIGASYAGSRPAEGTLEITSYGGAGGIVEGTLSFEAQPTRPSAPHGPLARFQNGWFRAVIDRPR